jgi:spermidine/putrescine-binding protein
MRRVRSSAQLPWLAVAAAVCVACSGESESQRPTVIAREQQTVNICNWVDEAGPNTYRDFEKRTGVHVDSEPLTSNRVLETQTYSRIQNWRPATR